MSDADALFCRCVAASAMRERTNFVIGRHNAHAPAGRGPLFIWALCATPRRAGKIYYHFGGLCETLFPAVILWLIGRCLRRKGFVTIFNFPLAAFGPRRVLAGGFLFGPRPRR
jgi:hypothetical protein